MVAEIAPAGGRIGRDDRQAVRQGRQGKGLLPVDQALFLEFGDGLAPDPLLLPEGRPRVQLFDDERQAEDFVVTDPDPGKDGHPGLQVGAGFLPEHGGKQEIAVAPDDGPDLGHHPALLSLAELEVAVTALHADRTDLRPHPDTVREQVLDPLLQVPLEGQQIHEIIFHHKVPRTVANLAK